MYTEFSAYQDIKQLEHTLKHDIKAVEYWINEQMIALGLPNYAHWLHFGCTSEDINNLAYTLLVKESQQLLCHAVKQLYTHLDIWAKEYADIPMLGRTHGQPATPTTLGKELANFSYRLKIAEHTASTTILSGKINGAVGNFNALLLAYPHYDWLTHARTFVESFGFEFVPYTTQVENKDRLCRYLSYISQINTIVLDYVKDMWMYNMLGYWTHKHNPHEIGSSTMPHKINPIHFENAEGNINVAQALLSLLINNLPMSRLQRDLSGSTVMRNIGVAIGHTWIAYQACLTGMQTITPCKQAIQNDLDNHWEVLSEALQTFMRSKGIQNAYEQIKQHTRGMPHMRKEDYIALVDALPLTHEDRVFLKTLTPSLYLGAAPTLAQNIGSFTP